MWFTQSLPYSPAYILSYCFNNYVVRVIGLARLYICPPLFIPLFLLPSPGSKGGLVLVELDWDLFGSTWIWIAEVKFSLSFSLWLFVVVGLCTLFYQDGYYVLDFGLWFLMM